ncbi:DNA-binding response regulator [Actinosynnema sp. ALI-1.44]|uniref:response regulator n=1 Tax=Actinosynnema sp. ALI-1.44 TaxID=1933779 RepID=UPI00097C5246|nr:response regulator transcription factor [Actinosynnema sp. ALI-1.44]ONI75223.1 DNA-binding response regulator [Actinosynnema sp. ALI-1.44]
MIRVLVTDDHPIVRTGLIATLETEPDIEIVAEAGSGAEAVALVRLHRPEIVMLDLRMDGMDGADTTRHIREISPETVVIIVTTYDDAADILRCIEAGAAGYMLKGSSRTELVDAVRAAAGGATVLTPSLAPALYRARGAEATTLSTREQSVLRLVAKGMSNPGIAAELFVAEATVKTHLLRIFKKLGVSSRTAAVVTAKERGLLR